MTIAHWFLIILICVEWLLLQFLTAPIGYEDEDGFHYGEPPDDDDSL